MQGDIKLTQYCNVLKFISQPCTNAPNCPVNTLLSLEVNIMIMFYWIYFSICSEKLKATQVSKVAGLDNLSGHFLKDGATFLSKLIDSLINLSVISEKFPVVE